MLDEQGRVVELLLLQELIAPAKLPNAVVIMAGGREPVKSLHRALPKPMLPVDGKPMLEILLEQCIAIGFRHFIFQ